VLRLRSGLAILFGYGALSGHDCEAGFAALCDLLAEAYPA